MPPKKGGKSGRGKKGAGKSRGKGGEGKSVSSKAGGKGKSAKSNPSRSPSIDRMHGACFAACDRVCVINAFSACMLAHKSDLSAHGQS